MEVVYRQDLHIRNKIDQALAQWLPAGKSISTIYLTAEEWDDFIRGYPEALSQPDFRSALVYGIKSAQVRYKGVTIKVKENG